MALWASRRAIYSLVKFPDLALSSLNCSGYFASNLKADAVNFNSFA